MTPQQQALINHLLCGVSRLVEAGEYSNSPLFNREVQRLLLTLHEADTALHRPFIILSDEVDDDEL